MFNYRQFVNAAFEEDVRDGDHSTLASIPADLEGKARFIYKDQGLVAGIEEIKKILFIIDPKLVVNFTVEDGHSFMENTEFGTIEGSVHSILTAERLCLNIMQRMSGIATLTQEYVQLMGDSQSKLLDTRKTTPLLRHFEKEAVKIGGGENHRHGLYDMIMLKDNHTDFCGSITKALDKTYEYLKEKDLDLKVEVECGNMDDVNEVLAYGKVNRIMLDNFTPEEIVEALKVIDGRMETEASGGINSSNLREYAATNVDYISIGALTHQAVSKDISLKAEF